MSFNKHIFKQFDKDFKKEVKSYEAYQEKRQVEFPRCNHSKAKMVNGELRCPCGAAWRGPRIADLLESFKRRQNAKRRKDN